MPANRLTYDSLQSQVKMEVVRYTLLRGQGGPLLLLWSVGIALFLTVLNLPLVVLPWTLAITAFTFLAARDYLYSLSVQTVLYRLVVEKRFPPPELSDAALEAGIGKGKEMFVEIALKVAEIEASRGADPALRQVVSDTDGMIRLQLESARQAVNLDRALRLVGPGADDSGATPATDATSGVPSLLRENIQAIRRQADGARRLAGEITQQLETLMLQVFQLEQRAVDVVRTAEFAQETEELLGKIQGEVDAQRLAAQGAIEMLMPG